ncbi:PREDICTED: NAC transcription factor 29-like isoform X2 [Prunus mume]|uniref:NAC transcription factor 29-like isoform X2 n=1 Tax=Prunus mume TaxID=102107 RepID=A0ABM1LXX0_PRUMU|nr:PREDICTED: NAC transcription factor 29-like isoform X2 [Prunus mume]
MGSKCYRKTTEGDPVPLGFRFHPTEEELVDYYLKNKRQDRDFNVNHIPEIDICKYDPWEIPGLLFAEQDSPYMEWFFFSRRDYKYMNSNRSNRATPHGSWKITGKERMIRARGSNAVIGTKRTMTFYERGVLKSKKTNWVMHEYNLFESEASPDPQLAERDFVLYRMKKNPDKKDTSVFAEGEPSSYNWSNCEDQAAHVTPESQDHSPSTLQSPAYIELGDVLQVNGFNGDCNDMQSPFGDNDYSVTHKNDFSTFDEVAYDMSQELYAQQDKNSYMLMPQSPTFRNLEDFTYINASDFGNQTANNMVLEAQDYHSFTLPSPIYSELGSVPHDDVYNNEWQSAYANFENQTTDERISEECPQPKENLRSILSASQLADYTSQSLMNTEEYQRRHCEIGIEGAAGMNWEGSFFNFPLKP